MFRYKSLLGILVYLVLTGCIAGVRLYPARNHYRVPEIAVWMPFWDWERSYATLRKQAQAIDIVMPFWYDVSSTGNIIPAQGIAEMTQAGKLNLDMKQFTRWAHQHQIKVMPLVSNEFNGQLIHQILSDETLRSQHIQSLLELVKQNKFDGLDLDYEGMLAVDRELYPAFLRDLAAELHREKKKLSVCVHAKTSEPGGWDAVIAQDYQAIGKYADIVRIMAYDFHYASGEPGPISPPDWITKVLQFAVTQIPREKISLGIGIYGINWASSPTGFREKPELKDEEAMYLDAKNLAKKEHVQINFDSTSQECWFSYTDSSTGVQRTVWFLDHRGFKSRWQLAKQYRVGSVSLWRLGGEDPYLWRYIRADKFIGFNDSSEFWLFEMDRPSHTRFGLEIIFGK
ncbi:MAG: glycosyl hydrolase family 18 protein [bacterium]|nr:glycosyl hydrolase family 18 protein [bacterium]